MKQYIRIAVILPTSGGNRCGLAEIEGPKMGNTQSDVLTVDEAAESFKIPSSSVYKPASKGKSLHRKWAGIGAFTAQNS